MSEETKKKIREKRKYQVNTVNGMHWKIKDTHRMKGKTKGEKNINWKGDKVGYRSLHKWVQWWRGKATKCEECGLSEIPKDKKRYFQWSNVSRLYLRDLADWRELCVMCHKHFDKVI